MRDGLKKKKGHSTLKCVRKYNSTNIDNNSVCYIIATTLHTAHGSC